MLNAEQLAGATRSAVEAIVRARTWTTDELVMVVLFPEWRIEISITTCTALLTGGFGKSDAMRGWLEQERTHRSGIPVLFSVPSGFRVWSAPKRGGAA